MRFRAATESDAFAIMELFHRTQRVKKEVELSGLSDLERAISSKDSWFLIIEIGGAMRGLVSMIFDANQGLCKLNRLLACPSLKDGRTVLSHALEHVLHSLRTERPEIDMVYTTTTSISLDEQSVTLDAGFKIFGVFPNLLGMDSSQLNGLSAYFLGESLHTQRPKELTIHPVIKPFFDIVQRQCQLPDVTCAKPEAYKLKPATSESPIGHHSDTESDDESLAEDDLEVIDAAGFVGQRFRNHIERHSQLINFYPFYSPNALITDPHQRCEIFVKIVPHARFAAIIGEHLTVPMDPVRLYLKVQALLKERGVSYIEIINDAADVVGTECILSAGFTPCAYVPAFKRQGRARRDFVVFGKSFEYLCRPDFKAHQAYLEFYREYFHIEGKNYFPDFF